MTIMFNNNVQEYISDSSTLFTNTKISGYEKQQ